MIQEPTAIQPQTAKWKRNAEWPCPACGSPSCDLDIRGERHPNGKFYRFVHLEASESEHNKKLLAEQAIGLQA